MRTDLEVYKRFNGLARFAKLCSKLIISTCTQIIFTEVAKMDFQFMEVLNV